MSFDIAPNHNETFTGKQESAIDSLETSTFKDGLNKTLTLPGGGEVIAKIDRMLNKLGLDFAQLNNMFVSLSAETDSIKRLLDSLNDMYMHLHMNDKEGMRVVMDELEVACEQLEKDYDSVDISDQPYGLSEAA